MWVMGEQKQGGLACMEAWLHCPGLQFLCLKNELSLALPSNCV